MPSATTLHAPRHAPFSAAARVPVPAPGLALGPYPQRTPPAWPRSAWARHAQALQAHLAAWADAVAERVTPAAAQQPWLQAVRQAQTDWAARSPAAWGPALHGLRADLARQGWQPLALQARALGCVAAAANLHLQRNPFDTQLLAAGLLLRGRLAEMATGEGKTLAAALAAAVAALAGTPVHVMTVNDYLVQRDADGLRPLYTALGLRVGCVLATQALPARRAAYACDVAYTTAREVAFDWLRDRLGAAPDAPALQQGLARWLDGEQVGDQVGVQAGVQAGGQGAAASRLRGLCMAVVDEADSLLIDEAGLPLILSEPVVDDALRAACFQALHLGRQLHAGEHFDLPAGGGVAWKYSAEQTLDTLAEGLGGAWLNRRHRQELVGQALQALHALQRDTHYLVRQGQVQLLDAGTGRVAEGRRWSRSLHALVELKEGLAPSAASATVARISVQRFFAHYLHLCGMSGTLRECRGELRRHYGLGLARVPLRRPLQRRAAAPRLFATEAARRQACAGRAAALAAQGRAVLVGMGSVAASQAMGDTLQALGLPHRVLDARHDADEAAIVAAAGQAGSITVATQMAGRGTDILLGPEVAARGGLHVINCQDNLEARLDRQLEGRAGRQGEPGSSDTWHALDAPAHRGRAFLPFLLRTPWLQRLLSRPTAVHLWAALGQRAQARRHTRFRLHLLQQEQQWQHDLSFTTLRA